MIKLLYLFAIWPTIWTAPRSASAQPVATTTNWVYTTNWVRRLDLRVVSLSEADRSLPFFSGIFYAIMFGDGGLVPFSTISKPTEPTWRTLTMSATADYFIDGIRSKVGWDLKASVKLQPGTTNLCVIAENRVSVKNVPLSSLQTLDPPAREWQVGLARDLTIRAYPIYMETNFTGLATWTYYDYGLPYTNLVPVVTKRAILKTNSVEQAR